MTVPTAKIKDIKIWDTVHEGRKLPVQQRNTEHAALGPVPNNTTFRMLETEALAHNGAEETHNDICMLNKVFAAAMDKQL